MHCNLAGFINLSSEHPLKSTARVSAPFKLLLFTFDFNFSDLMIVLILYLIIQFSPCTRKKLFPDTPRYKWKKLPDNKSKSAALRLTCRDRVLSPELRIDQVWMWTPTLPWPPGEAGGNDATPQSSIFSSVKWAPHLCLRAVLKFQRHNLLSSVLSNKFEVNGENWKKINNSVELFCHVFLNKRAEPKTKQNKTCKPETKPLDPMLMDHLKTGYQKSFPW